MSMILFVLHDTEKLDPLLTAWEEAGVGGVTVFKSTGVGKIRAEQALRDDIPLMPDIHDFFPNPEHVGRTLFTIVPDALVPGVVSATEGVVGPLTEPNTGLLVVLPTTSVYGLEKRKK